MGEIVLVCSPERRFQMQEQVVDPLYLATPLRFADSGPVRQQSCLSGLREADTDRFPFVAIHDAARPLVRVEDVEGAIARLREADDLDGVVCGLPAVDTIKVCDDGAISDTPERSRCWQAQTPQVFPSAMALEAHESAADDGFVGTDDASLVERLGGRVAMHSVGWGNAKVTVPQDMVVAAAVLAHRGMAGPAAGGESR